MRVKTSDILISQHVRRLVSLVKNSETGEEEKLSHFTSLLSSAGTIQDENLRVSVIKYVSNSLRRG